MRQPHDSPSQTDALRLRAAFYRSLPLLLAGLLALSLACVPASYTNNTGPATSTGNAAGSFTGQWLIEFRTDENMVQMSMRYKSRDGSDSSNNSFHLSLDQLTGLTREQVMSGGTRVQFQLKRDAGSFNCEGWFKEGNGSGHYVFSADTAFAAELNRRGYGTPSAEQQFALALNNVSLAFVEELRAQGYARPSLDRLVDAGEHGVRLEYVQGLKSLGYELRSVDQLIEMVDHGVHLKFIRELAALGYERVPAEQLINLVDHGVQADFVRELKAQGYERLSLDQLVEMRDHGVSVRFIRELAALGYDKLPVDQLIEMEDHGVNTELVEDLKRLGYERVPVDQLIRLRDHGVSASFIQRMKARGYQDLEQIIELRDRGGAEE